MQNYPSTAAADTDYQSSTMGTASSLENHETALTTQTSASTTTSSKCVKVTIAKKKHQVPEKTSNYKANKSIEYRYGKTNKNDTHRRSYAALFGTIPLEKERLLDVVELEWSEDGLTPADFEVELQETNGLPIFVIHTKASSRYTFKFKVPNYKETTATFQPRSGHRLKQVLKVINLTSQEQQPVEVPVIATSTQAQSPAEPSSDR